MRVRVDLLHFKTLGGGTSFPHGGGFDDVSKALLSHGQRNNPLTETLLVTHALTKSHDGSEDGSGRGVPLVTAIQERAVSENLNAGPQGKGYQENVAFTLEARNTAQAVQSVQSVRRLTPRECERLQGFPDDYTLIKYKGKPAADSPRYQAIGNSMAVPVMRWIGERIEMVDKIKGTK